MDYKEIEQNEQDHLGLTRDKEKELAKRVLAEAKKINAYTCYAAIYPNEIRDMKFRRAFFLGEVVESPDQVREAIHNHGPVIVATRSIAIFKFFIKELVLEICQKKCMITTI